MSHLKFHDNNSRLLRISSKDRSPNSKSQYDIIYDTNDNDLHQIKKILLKSAIIPNTQYNVNTYNDEFKFEYNGGDLTFTIPQGQYDVNDLIAELTSQIDALITPQTISINQTALTQKLTFTLSAGTMKLYNEEDGNSMGGILGINVSSSVASISQTADSLTSMEGLKNVYISSKTLSNHSAMIDTDKSKQNIFCDVPIRAPFGSIATLEEDENSMDYTVFHTKKNISSIDVTLLDENNNVLDLNGSDWVLIFRVYH
jgi:hypothetical protein